MCDACRLLGSPWLPNLHGGRARPRATAVSLGLRTKAKTTPTASGAKRTKGGEQRRK